MPYGCAAWGDALYNPGPHVANKPDSGCTAVRGCSLLFRLPTTLPKRE